MTSENVIRDQPFGAGVIRYDSRCLTAVNPSLFDPASPCLAATPVRHGGRQAAWFVSGDFGLGVLRHYRRGGFMARINRASYIWTGANSTRSFAEFQLLMFMTQAGLPVPQPLAAFYSRCGLFYRAAILIERIPKVQPLAKLLETGHHDAVAGAVLAMHNAGVWHADLNAYNILVNDQGQVWLIDFDKGKQMPMTRGRRADNLARLRRSLVKLSGSQGEQWWRRFNQAYNNQSVL